MKVKNHLKAISLLLFLISFQIIFAQNEVENQKQLIYKALQNKECDKAQAYYEGLKIDAGRDFQDIEKLIANCKKEKTQPSYLKLSAYSLSFIATGENKTISVNTSSGKWYIGTQPAPWVRLEVKHDGSGLTIAVSKNNATSNRSSYFTVVSDNITKTVEITQDPKTYSIGEDAKDFINRDGYTIAYLDESGTHGFAIKYDGYTEYPQGYALSKCKIFGPSIAELKLMYRNRYILRLHGEYWSETYAGGGNGMFNLSKNYTFDYNTGETHKRRTGKTKCNRLKVIRF